MQLCRIAKGVDESVLYWFDYTERMENDRIAKRVYMGVCVSSHIVGSIVNECLKKRG